MKYKVKSLYIYPVKSFGGMQVQQMEVTNSGPKYDRQWMVVDAKGKFITQRQKPRMSQITARIVDDAHVELTAPGVDFMDFGTDEVNTTESIEVKIWGQKVSAFEVDEEVSQWVSDYLKFPCKLVRMPEESAVEIDSDYGEGLTKFSDGFPFLLLSAQSLDLLNQKLNKSFAVKRFRPNILVQLDEPHQEDYWTQIQIGDVLFRGAKLCSRCKITTIDPMTGEFGDEPLETLSEYRKTDQGIVFGKNFVHESLGMIKQGMDIEVLEYLDYQPVLEDLESEDGELEDAEEDFAEL